MLEIICAILSMVSHSSDSVVEAFMGSHAMTLAKISDSMSISFSENDISDAETFIVTLGLRLRRLALTGVVSLVGDFLLFRDSLDLFKSGVSE